ncbi:uncharacterized protein PODANS_2_14090 [Podospora anserina S mat+]|uniref:Podospora anserina S mat+ genomic DNA chromosome 2, supercontig 3 n=1 Tax=Podospora anserina (strain S / ATCC MYA-4624 / DSM 980 / FGSC 10383) TaxID=515849 RepID=B2AC36_PODAN|nr:uncharacterized protein PODANS_2_14090 [Podospora anserina S mat+]CAP61011.1 unnamed protein product [Podospora anserina S mat+]CDP26416.1 Putative protein of unknown function [Podospora anserina S mat+]
MGPGGLAQMSHPPYNTTHGLGMASSGLASRRGGQNLKPLSFEGMKTPTEQDNGLPTPRTSRGHLLAGLRTAPKSAMASSFPNNGPASPTVQGPAGRNNRNSMGPGMFDNMYGGPKTSIPRFGGAHQQQVQQAQQQQAYNVGGGAGGYSQQHYTTEQILAPPQIQLDDVSQDQLDPNIHAQLLYTNAYLSEQQQRLQQQLKALQAAAQQFQGLNLNAQAQLMQQQNSMMQQQGFPNMYQQQAQLQGMMGPTTPDASNVYYDPRTGQIYMDPTQVQVQAQLQAQAQAQLNAQYLQQAQAMQAAMQQQQQQQQQAGPGAPRVQVSPPPEARNSFRSPTPPRRYDSPLVENPAPLPPPSANAFRRGHKKIPSTVTPSASKTSLTISTGDEPLKTAASSLKTGSFPPMTPLTSGYGPGQARAGEHPVRQPRNPPSLDELKSKPTAKHDGSKNFVTRTRRTVISNIVRAGMERRKEARGSGSVSPVSESAEETVETPVTDNDSDSGRSGSGSLVERDDAECSLPSSRTSTGSWGAIGSDRPSSRQKYERRGPDSASSSDNEGLRDSGSFASLLKNSSRRVKPDTVEGQRKAAMLVLTSSEKRKLVV